MPKRRLAALSVGALSAGALTFGAMAPANAASGTVSIDRTYTYACDVTLNYVIGGEPGDITLEDQPIGVRAQASVPAVLEPGATVPATPTTITLVMNGGLQAATSGLGGVKVDGSSDDSSIGFTLAGHQAWVPIDGLSVKDSPIPAPDDPAHPVDGDWTIPITGTVEAIHVPDGTAGQTATLQMPAAFSANADFTVDPSMGVDSMSAVMDCTFNDDSPELLAAALPIKAPTTTTATVAPTTAYGTSTRVSYSIKGADAGAVQVLDGSRVVANGKFSGGSGSVTLPGTALAAGRHTLTVRYAGNSATQASSATAVVTVAKAASSIGKAKAKPKKITAKKAKKAKVVTTVTSAVGTPTGTVVVKVKNKKLGSASLTNGTATVKLKKLAKLAKKGKLDKLAKKGKLKLTVTYSGSANISGSSKTVKVKVKK